MVFPTQFKLITSSDNYNAGIRADWLKYLRGIDIRLYRSLQERYGDSMPAIMKEFIVPRNFPCLAINVITHNEVEEEPERLNPRIKTIICTRNEAKRLVYHSTNRGRTTMGTAFLFVANEAHAISIFDGIVEYHQLMRSRLLNNFMAKKKLSMTKSRLSSYRPQAYPILITSFSSWYEGNLILNFFEVTLPQAKKLVYYQIEKKRKNKGIYRDATKAKMSREVCNAIL